RIQTSYDAGDHVVVVVSARSGVTNDLINRASRLTSKPDCRELDMLLSIGEQETIALVTIALHALGVPAVSRTGAQAGIITTDQHTQARILHITGGDIKEQLDAGRVVVVAGFQGVSDKGEITTLGRGSSDLTAVAIASFLEADRCEIYTDVEGVHTGDPSLIADATLLKQMDYGMMQELSSSGFKVVQARAVQLAERYKMPMVVSSSKKSSAGTSIQDELSSFEGPRVYGVALDKQQAKILIEGIAHEPRSLAQLFAALKAASVEVGMVLQSDSRDIKKGLSITVPHAQLHAASAALEVVFDRLGEGRIIDMGPVAKLSVVGAGMRSDVSIMATLLAALAEAQVQVLMVSTSEVRITVVIPVQKAEEALRFIHSALGLGSKKTEEALTMQVG
ncbi:MAG TPA: aspartate kinase, partial [Opitutae bacterium]|nr:aspartate kinase [Opitutae bacterium]